MTDRTEIKPTNDPIKSADLEAVDTDDCFDLACEVDEFGVHAPDQTDT